MKKLKFAFWLILIGFFALLIYQNLEFFSETYSIKINLGIYQRQTPEMTHGAIMASFVGVAVLIMLIFYFSSKYENYRAKKTIKSLTHTLDESAEMISNLKKELETQQQDGFVPPTDETAAAEATADESPEPQPSDVETEKDANPAQSA